MIVSGCPRRRRRRARRSTCDRCTSGSAHGRRGPRRAAKSCAELSWTLVSERGDGLIDTGLPALGRGKRRDDNGHSAVVRGVPDREAPLGQDDRPGFRYVGKTEAVREQVQDKPLGGTDVAVPNGTESFPVSQSDLVVLGDLVAQLAGLPIENFSERRHQDVEPDDIDGRDRVDMHLGSRSQPDLWSSASASARSAA